MSKVLPIANPQFNTLLSAKIGAGIKQSVS
jgi:hypothetical protein